MSMDNLPIELVGVGVYTIPQASKLTRVPASSIRRWLFGYRYKYKGQEVSQHAVVAIHKSLRDLRVLTFRDLIEMKFVHAFRAEGVSWNTLRIAVNKAAELTRAEHPFASQQFVTDGKTIFAEIAQTTGNKELLDLKSDQMAFKRVMLPSLRSNVDFGEAGIERWWPLGKRKPIVLDPTRQFGQPILDSEGVPTEVLSRAYSAVKDIRHVANWYRVSQNAVRSAIEFEDSLAA
jgi:uncharacterized protein (DUF433 family)